MKRAILLLMIFGIAGASSLFGQAPSDSSASDQSASEAAIRKMAAAYVEAFNKHDAKALADQWSPDAVYLNRATGEEVVGRTAIAEQFKTLFQQQPNLKLIINVDSVQFISPNVAVEQGKSKFVTPGAEPEEVDYTAINVKRDGKWLLDRVTDKATESTASHHEQLKALEWMVGQWTSDDDNAEVSLDCNWTKNQNFLTRTFKLSVDGDTITSGMQVIGWDPAAKVIRSWTFDSNGAFAEATWQHSGDTWYLRNRGTLPDGRPATMINEMKQVDANAFTWQTVERTAGDELLPNIDEIRIVRR